MRKPLIEVQLHFCGEQTKQRSFRAVPAIGSYIYGPISERRLWQVEAGRLVISESLDLLRGARSERR